MRNDDVFVGEDVIIARTDRPAFYAERVKDQAQWSEIVPGLADCALQFDPLILPAEEAEAVARAALTMEYASSEAWGDTAATRTLHAEIGGEAGPEAAMVAERLGLANEKVLARWLGERAYIVALIGFQPGFAYLDDLDPGGLPQIERLDTPRQKVAAGSIGFLGERACLYPHEGPGGWPIIGRVRERLFDPAVSPPALLHRDQRLRFSTE